MGESSDELFRLRMLLEYAQDIVFHQDASGAFTYVSPAAETVTGYKPEEWFSSYAARLTANPINQEAARITEEMLRTGTETALYQVEILGRNGQPVRLEMKKRPYFGEGGLRGIIGVARDVTERVKAEEALRESEERHRLILQGSSAGIWEARFSVESDDGSWHIASAYFSPRLEELLGYQDRRLDVATGWSHVHPEDRQLVSDALKEHLERRAPYDVEYRVRTADGEWRWFRGSGQAAWDEAGKPLRMAGALTDITARKQAEQRERQREEEMARVSRLHLANQIAVAWAHEVNQPLTAIVGYARGCALRLRRGAGRQEEIAEAMDEIAVEAIRAGDIINRLRAILRKREGERLEVDLGALVKRVVQLVEPQASKRGVAVHVELSRELPPVNVDGVGIEQVILNLVRNALEAMEDGGARGDELTIEARLRGGREVEVAISDTGPGLPAADPGKVFAPFFTTKPGGLGLGLAVSLSIIEAHGGRMWAESRPVRGATFGFTLPLSTQAR